MPSWVRSSSRTKRTSVQLSIFFAITFLLAWGTWIPLFVKPSLPRQIAFVGLFAPALAGLMTAALYGGKESVREVLRRLTILRFPLRWALLSAALMPAVYLTALGALRVLRPQEAVPLFTSSTPSVLAGGFLWLVFVTSGEEIGWRGFALPHLLTSSDRPVIVGLGLGLVWGLWHLPLYLLPGQSAFPLPLFLVFTSVQSVLYTFIFLKTNGSLVPALLLHAGTDIAPRVFQLPHLPVSFWIVVDLTLAFITVGFVLARRGDRKPCVRGS